MLPLYVGLCGSLTVKMSILITLFIVSASSAISQGSDKIILPPVEVEQPNVATKSQPTKNRNKIEPSITKTPQKNLASSENETRENKETIERTDPYAVVPPGARSGSLGVATPAEARADINRLPGGVEVIPSEEYAKDTPAVTLKDALDYVPGVYVQTKWGEDSRLSIRGSGLSRNFHLRGIQLYMNGIPLNTADGFGDFQEIDPSAYRYIEVYKGANALRFGTNSLGGAINFVMPTGYDSDLFGARVDFGSFGLFKTSVSSGAVSGNTDYAFTTTWLKQDGFREHSDGESLRGSGNIGLRLSPNVETRFFINANTINQRIPGTVTKKSALTDPKAAAFINELNDWQRNIDSVRIANQTTFRVAPGTLIEFGAYYFDKHLMHPIFRWLDYSYADYGGYSRLNNESRILGYRNIFIAGFDFHNGTVDAQQFVNGVGAKKGSLLSYNKDSSQNYSTYAENSLFFMTDVALVTGFQYLYAKRSRDVLFTSVGDIPGQDTFSVFLPKLGMIWDVNTTSQIFANISKSAEVPSFGENTVGSIPFTALLQEAITYEIGTRGRMPNLNWDLSLYRANIHNELQCLTIINPFFTNQCAVTNADSTVHQGIELGFSAVLLPRGFESIGSPDQLWLTTGYTLNNFFFNNDALWGDNQIPGIPKHVLKSELIYRHPCGTYVGPTIEWAPERYYVDNANTLEVNGYTIWGMKFGYEGTKFTTYLEARNLSNETYISSVNLAGNLNGMDGNYFEPGTGRALYGGLQFRW